MITTSTRGERRRALRVKTTPTIYQTHPLGNRHMRRWMDALDRKSPRTIVMTKGAFGKAKI